MADCITINEVKIQLKGEPFDQYIEAERSVIKLDKPYLAGWKLINNKLYLIELFGRIEGKTKASLSTYFGNKMEVEAYWFTGELIIQLNPFHLKRINLVEVTKMKLSIKKRYIFKLQMEIYL